MLKKTAPFLATALAVTLSCNRPQKATDESTYVMETLQPMLDTLKQVRSEHFSCGILDVTDEAETVAFQRKYKQLPPDFRDNYEMAIYPGGNLIKIADKETDDGFMIDYDKSRETPRQIHNAFATRNLSSKIRSYF